MKINRGELVVPALMAAFTAAYYWQVREVPSEVLIWPGYITIVLGILAMLVLLTYAFKGAAGKAKKGSLRRPCVLVLITAAYLGTMKYSGFTIGSFLYLVIVQLYLGSEKKRAFGVALAVALFLHFVMVVGLGLAVPRLRTPWFNL